MKRILILLIAILTVFAMSSCDAILDMLPIDIPGLTDKEDSDGEKDDDGEDEGKDEGEKLEGLVLIENGKANFKIVFSGSAGGSTISKINSFVKKLRNLGIEVDDPVRAGEATDPSECEILVGPGITGRGDECFVNDKDYGEKGYVIKTVGKRIIIAGGSQTMTSNAFDTFVKTYLKVTDKTKELENLCLTEDILVEKFTEYMIKSITVGGSDLSEFVILKDLEGIGEYGDEFVTKFRTQLYADSGYWLEIIDAGESTDKAHKIVIRYTDSIEGDTDGKGFVARVDGGDLVIECSYANATEKYFEKTVKSLILDKMGDISIPSGYENFEPASVVYYDDFGAVGDGKTDDFKAIAAAHKYANECGQTVMGKEGAVYYVDRDFTYSIEVKTNINLGGATILINDDSDVAHANRGDNIFFLSRDPKFIQDIYTEDAIAEMFESYEKKITKDAKELPWLVPYLKGESYVIVTNKNHYDFIRFGANQLPGEPRQDMFLVDKDGKILEGYDAAFEFDDITRVEIYDTSEEELVIENGSIKNITCRVRAETQFKNKYLGYSRGIYIARSNVVIRDMTFRTVNEPDLDCSFDGNDSLTPLYGKRSESYPYGGFIVGNRAYNILVKDSTMSARTMYYEDKPATESTGGKIPAPVPMGSYGYTYSYSSKITHINVDQHCETGIADSRYWGIMNSNTCKNFYFDDCQVNRFDAHRGFWNGVLKNSTFAHTINLTGGGDVVFDKVEKLTGRVFIYIRGDYGGSFDGTVTLKDTTFYAYPTYTSSRGQTLNPVPTGETCYIIESGFCFDQTDIYLDWDFGYDCTLPHKVIFDNFKFMGGTAQVFNDLPEICFENDKKLQLGVTKEIIFRNMNATIPTTHTAGNTLSKVKVTVE